MVGVSGVYFNERPQKCYIAYCSKSQAAARLQRPPSWQDKPVGGSRD